DGLNSVSRLTSSIATPEQAQSARKMREALSLYQQAEDLIQLGAYVSGANVKLDAAIRARERMLEFLRQDAKAKIPLEDTLGGLQAVASLLP
ncbi:MAG: flagellum-specific ATP synthase FliI, partial [Acidobacteria bacterium]|nr:flagellum-specific ATP synthase FliI [Acidobacteriota bacterium]